MFDENMQLSQYYKLKDLIVTEQVLSSPNMPSTQTEIQNLTHMAEMLDVLHDYVGPFKLLSGYRTKELQNALAAAGDPVAVGTSYHELGLGVDIRPTSMGLVEYFGKLLADENIRNSYREISIKVSQNSIHLGAKILGDTRETKVLGLDENKKYVRLNLDQIQSYIAPYIQTAEETVQVATQIASANPMSSLFLVLGLVSAGAYLILRKR